MGSTALATTEKNALATSLSANGSTALDLMHVMDDLIKVGRFFVESGLMPPGVNTPSKAALIIWKGHELGIKPMQAVAGINIISGRPSVAPQLMLNKIIQSKEAEIFRFVESTDKICTIHAKRKNGLEITESFSMADASKIMTKENDKVIPLSEKANYRNQPKVMLRWRCVGAVGRLIFPDIIEGCHTPDELEDVYVPFDEIVSEPTLGGVVEPAASNAQSGSAPVVDAEYDTQAQQQPAAAAAESVQQAPGNPSSVKLVSAPQAKALVKAMKENGINEGEFLKKHNIESIEFLPASLFQEALKAFNAAKGTAGTPADAASHQPKTITEEQAKALQALVDKLGPTYDKSKLFAHFKIKALGELPADNYAFVHETLAKKLAA